MTKSWIKKPISAKHLQHWLIEKDSLTACLQAYFTQFSVQLVKLEYAKPVIDESILLQIPNCKTCLVREVLLIGGGHPVVFAHSVIPRLSLRGTWNGLGRLGNKPLGAALFANPQVKRAPLRFKKLSPHHVLYQKAAQHLSEKPAYLWARRSVFSLNCATILVTEVFLPPLLSK